MQDKYVIARSFKDDYTLYRYTSTPSLEQAVIIFDTCIRNDGEYLSRVVIQHLGKIIREHTFTPEE